MRPPSKLARVIAYALGVTLLAFVGLGLWTVFAIRSMRFDFHFSETDLETVATSFKSMLSNVFVVRRDAAAVSDEVRFPNPQRDPNGVAKNAKLFDAWVASAKLGAAVLSNTRRGNWVGSSAEADFVPVQDRVDPWNHTFCILRRDDYVLVVSGGPEAQGSPACRNVQIQAKDLAELPHGKLLESPAGYLVLLVDKDRADQRN